MSRLLDWIRGRGRNPLESPHGAATGEVVRAAVTEPSERAAVAAPAADDDPLGDGALAGQAQALGVSVEMLRTMHGARRELVALVAQDPRAWGFDLVARGAVRRDLAAEFRQRTRLTGTIGDSFLQGHEPLLALAPDPLTTPAGHPLDRVLREQARLDADAARDLARHLRVTVQASLGAPLDHESIEHAVRELAWDHELDAARIAPQVLDALADVTA
ncbi:MAG: hypothetical protein JWM86_405 [Thermoleophilia bacterium]|nr:hypothetical protein [Thermoleophilia bacterium]